MSSYTWGEGFTLVAKNLFIAPIDYNHRALAWWSTYGDYGVYVEYTRATCEFCLYVIVGSQLIYVENRVYINSNMPKYDTVICYVCAGMIRK